MGFFLFVAHAAALLNPTPPARSASVERATPTRREALLSTAATSLLALGSVPMPAAALIKGSAPPEKMKPKKSKCTSIDECEAMGDAERAAQSAGQDTTVMRTSGGDRYRDLTGGSGKEVRNGDAVEIRYRVMRLGTKARDGLSGEGQTVFSYGFGEDEDKDGDKVCEASCPLSRVPPS